MISPSPSPVPPTEGDDGTSRPAYWTYDIEPSIEEGGSVPIALYFTGHLDLDLVERVGREYFAEEHYVPDEDEGEKPPLCTRPQHLYLRKIPATNELGDSLMRHEDQRNPGRGAKPVTKFEWLDGWATEPCQAPRDSKIRCNSSAVTGFHPSNVIGRTDDDDFYYLCRAHARDFQTRLDAATAERMAAAYRKANPDA